ncbi:thioredoxin [Patescibacteria group bacterium]|nr:thioredoxin [Patescibacteria group bacterium]
MPALHIDDTHFEEEVVKSDKIVLVDFFASWCGPCQALGPIIDELADEQQEFKICKIDIDANSESASKYGVMSIPTLVFFKEGAEVNRLQGLKTKEELLETLTNLK